jgi:hypothetical protein
VAGGIPRKYCCKEAVRIKQEVSKGGAKKFLTEITNYFVLFPAATNSDSLTGTFSTNIQIFPHPL